MWVSSSRWVLSLGLVVALAMVVSAGPSSYNKLCPAPKSDSWMDMSSWLQAGLACRWEVLDGGRTVKQYVNSGDPGFYVSEEEIIDVVVKGTIQVEQQKNSDGSLVATDNDFLGFAVGYQAPMPFTPGKYDMLLFSWGGTGDGAQHSAYNLHKLNGSMDLAPTGSGHGWGDQGDCFWKRWQGWRTPGVANSNGVREAHGCHSVKYADNSGWRLNDINTFQMLFTEDEFKVSISGITVFHITQEQAVQQCEARSISNKENCKTATGKAWRKGRLAWYNFSQNGVAYGNIRKFKKTPGMAGTPVAAEDLFGVSRTLDRTGYKVVTKPFYDGLLGNDWSPLLHGLEAKVAATPGADPKTSTSASATCSEGSKLDTQLDGSFTFTPAAGLITKVNAGQVSVETCEYRVRDAQDQTQWSDLVNVTFAYEPETLVCPPEGCFDINWEGLTYPHDWYKNIPVEAPFGDLYANGTCVRIVDWQLPDGGAGGRFKLNANQLVAAQPDRIEMKFLERTFYRMRVKAIDIFGLTSTHMITITIPAECELEDKCVCDNLKCRCFHGYAGPTCNICESNRKNISVNPNCTACAECPQPISPPLSDSITGPCLYPTGQCDTFCTRNNTCNNNGKCVDDLSLIAVGNLCACDENFAGTACDKCKPDYYNFTNGCNVYCVANTTCNDHGKCHNVTGACVCDPPFTGANCDQCLEPFFPAPTCDQVCFCLLFRHPRTPHTGVHPGQELLHQWSVQKQPA